MNQQLSRTQDDFDRVRDKTADHVNAEIDRAVDESISFYAGQPTEVISQRIGELDREWDIERTLQTNAATLALIGLSLGIAHDRRWLGLPVVVLSFLLMHSIQGWCPPVPLFRRMGVRTRQEIDREKYALKHLRGDFDHVRSSSEDEQAAATMLLTP